MAVEKVPSLSICPLEVTSNKALYFNQTIKEPPLWQMGGPAAHYNVAGSRSCQTRTLGSARLGPRRGPNSPTGTEQCDHAHLCCMLDNMVGTERLL